jgi:hypothetical protein
MFGFVIIIFQEPTKQTVGGEYCYDQNRLSTNFVDFIACRVLSPIHDGVIVASDIGQPRKR